MEAADKLLEVVRKTVTQLFPELTGRYHLWANSKVIKTGDGLHLQLLTRTGSVDPTTPPTKCDPVPYKLKVGNAVKVCFLYGDPSEPWPVPLSTAAIGTYSAGQVDVEGWGTKPAIVADYLLEHTRVATITKPVDPDGNDLPGAESNIARIDYMPGITDGDLVAAVPIEEGERFIVLAKLQGA